MSEDNFALSDVPESSIPLGITLTDTSLRDKTWLYSALTIAPTGATITYFLCEDLQEQYPVTLGQLARELALYSEYQRYSQHTSMRADARLEFFNRGMLELFVVDVIEPRYKDYAINHLMNLGKHAPRTYTFDQLFTEPLRFHRPWKRRSTLCPANTRLLRMASPRSRLHQSPPPTSSGRCLKLESL
jgi:hypothetical protein